jgi:hypothetical protein
MTDESAPWDTDGSETPQPTTAKPISSVAEIPAVADYLKRIGGRATSFKTAVVERKDGKYDKVLATIRFTAQGVVMAPSGYEATEGELAAISAALPKIKFPTHQPVTALHSLPIELETADPESLFRFYDDSGQIVMLQHRVEKVDGKAYVPWTYWSDGIWRRMEPEGNLPLWGLDQLKDNSVVFIHEGAKASRSVWEQCEGEREALSPWVNELKNAAHLGWIGGAHAVSRTDWAALRKRGIKRAYIVADNDAEGRAAVPTIAQEIGCPALLVQFTQEWPDGFDLGDPFPDEMYADVGGERTYTGPSFASSLHPATWATDEHIIPAEGRGPPRRVYTLRPTFAAQWTWVETVDLFINNEFPSIQLKRESFNASVRPFSHVKDTAALLQASFTGRSATLTYRPDLNKRFVLEDGTSAINLYRPPLIKPKVGDVSPWHDFLAYMFPDPFEREHIMRWCATLIARPDIRMVHGLLILSETQGVGKTTLGQILADLVGRHNCSFPGVNMIVEQQFTGWLANKRLIVVNEIYEGHSWKAYNRLKTYLTDDYVEANIKHLATYTIPNWTHYYLCSNELIALKIEDKDRRWFVPNIAEVPWSHAKFGEFRVWLQTGGLAKIAAWAVSYGKYVRPGEIAPMTKNKQRLIEDSRSEAEHMAKQLAEMVLAGETPRVIPLVWVRDWVKSRLTGTVHESERKLGTAMKVAGMTVTEEPVILKGKRMRLATNRPELLADPDELVRHLTHPKNIVTEDF